MNVFILYTLVLLTGTDTVIVLREGLDRATCLNASYDLMVANKDRELLYGCMVNDPIDNSTSSWSYDPENKWGA